MIKKTLLLVLCMHFCVCNSVFSQNSASSNKNKRVRDSLSTILQKLNSSSSTEFNTKIANQSSGIEVDTFKIRILNALAWEYKSNNVDTAIKLSSEALDVASNYIHLLQKITKNETEKKIANDLNKLISKSYIQLGAFNNVQANYSQALDFNNKALEIWNVLEKDTVLNPYNVVMERKSLIMSNIGLTYSNLANYAKAMEYLFQALDLAEKLGDKSAISGRLTNIGNVYHYQKEHTKALSYHLRALNISEEQKNNVQIATCLSNVGIAYCKLKDYSKAIEHHLRALEIDSELDKKNDIARHYINIASVYYYQHNFEKTLEYDTKALETYKQIGNRNGVAMALGNIGSAYIKLKKYNLAEQYLQKAIQLSTAINALNLAKEHELFLYDLYRDSKQPQLALEHYIKYSTLKDSLFNEESTKKIVRSEMNFEFEKKQAIAKAEQEKQHVIAEKEKQKQRLILLFVVLVLVLISVFAWFVYTRWRITQKQKTIIEKQKEKIVDSINYAQFIQESILIDEKEIKKHLSKSFIFLQPKDIVSGDFYWFSRIVSPDSELMIIAAIDCTGHGVPGAFMSMIGNTLLNQIVNEKGITTPSDILYHLNLGVYEALKQKRSENISRDGMDMALCCIDYTNQQLHYSGAKNPLYVLNNNELRVVEASKESIGGGLSLRPKNPLETRFENHSIAIEKGMRIYLFSDGFKDQFGKGEKQKYGTKQFKELIIKANSVDTEQQKEFFLTALKNWQGDTAQTDDILVIGVEL
jgi:serine phosphatase RsbU (regulator of sigma subunit)